MEVPQRAVEPPTTRLDGGGGRTRMLAPNTSGSRSVAHAFRGLDYSAIAAIKVKPFIGMTMATCH